MQSKNLIAIADELRNERTSISERVAEVKKELEALEDEASRIDAALAGLSGHSLKAAVLRPRMKDKEAKRKSDTPSAKKADVIAAIRRVLEKEEVMSMAELKPQVEALVTSSGFNRFGFAMRWKEATQDSQFVQTDNGLTLRQVALST